MLAGVQQRFELQIAGLRHSQPSAGFPLQLEKPKLQTRPQIPDWHVGEELGPAGQKRPQLPQFCTSLEVLVSQPSAGFPLQLEKPGLHAAMMHPPPLHTTDAFGRGGQIAPLSTAPSQSSSTPLQTSALGFPGTALHLRVAPSSAQTRVPDR